MSAYQPQRYAQEDGLAEGYIALLSPWASYIDIEPKQWQRFYDWLLPPNRTSVNLYILHDKGQVLTVNPIYARAKLNIPDQITSPSELAKSLYTQWQRGTVVILERTQYQNWLDDIQGNAWIPGDDLLAYGLRIKDHALRYAAEGIVLYPSPLTAWQNIRPDLISRLGRVLAPDQERRSVILAVYDGAEIWMSLILTVQDGQVRLVTTLPPEALAASSEDWREDHTRVLPIVEQLAGPIRLGIFCTRQTFETLGISPAYWHAWLAAQGRDDVISIPIPLSSFKISD